MKKLLLLLALCLPLLGQAQYMNKWYGVKYDPTASATAVTRIAEDDDLTIHHHDNLPIQNLMKGCLLLDNGVVNYYLDPTDWTKKVGGAASVLTGADGQVMVEIPSHYELFETVSGWNYAKFSLTYKVGFRYVPKMYVGAFKATVTSSKMQSIGDGSAYPTTNFSRTTGRIYAQNRGVNWSMQNYRLWKTVYWLYIIEYANRDCQLAVGSPDGSGYQTGGIGAGVTALVNWDFSPSIKCGVSNSLANSSGSYALTGTIRGTTTTSTGVPRYRGIESPFGDIWELMDGCNIYHSVSPRASYAYISENPNYYADDAGDLGRARAVVSLAIETGYIQTIYFGSYGDPLPAIVGGAYWADYFYTPQPGLATSGWYIPLVGGTANAGAYAGFGYVSSGSVASGKYTDIGSRLCFLGS